MNFIMLSFTLFLMKKKIVPIRIILSAILGSIGGIIILLAGVRYGILYVVAALLNDFVMLTPCFKLKRHTISEVLVGIVFFHGLSFVYIKIENCIFELGIPNMFKNIALLVLGGIVVLVSCYMNKKRQQRIYRTVIKNNEEKIEFMSLYDTGNILEDPISHKPVSVMEENDVINDWIRRYPEKYKIIPYRSIGNEKGVLEGMCVDEIIVWNNDKEIIEKQAIIAVYKGKLSNDGSFKMILNNGVLSN